MKNDWEKFGDEIVRNIQEAIDNRDYSRLSQTINETVNQAMENVSRGMKNGGWYRDPNNGSQYGKGPNGPYNGGSYSGPNGTYGGAGGSYSGPNGAYGGAGGAYGDANGTYGGAGSAYSGSNGAYGGAGSAYSGPNGMYGGAGSASGPNGTYSSAGGSYGGRQGGSGWQKGQKQQNGFGTQGSYRTQGSYQYGTYGNDTRKYKNQGQRNWSNSRSESSGSSEKYELQTREKQLYLRGTSAKAGGIITSVSGYAFGISSAILTVLLGIAAFGTTTAGGIATLIGGSVVTASFFGMGVWGTRMIGNVGRFRKYVNALKGREYCDIKELAEKTGYSVKKVTKDLKKMIKSGWFRQGHLDEKETCLIASNDAYQQYTGLMDHMRQEEAAKAEAEKAEEQKYSKFSPEVQKVIREGDEYVARIRKANDAIPGEEISAKISRMEMLVDRIFDRVEQNPETVNDLSKLMDYYLPTTIKLLDAYAELDAEPVQGENIVSSKQEIEKTLDTLNIAFEKLLDNLFQDTAWDVSSDISVLHTMLAQEGLTEDGLKN